MPVFKVYHEITSSFLIGTYEADSKEEAEEMAYNDLPMGRDDYNESEEYVVEEVDEE